MINLIKKIILIIFIPIFLYSCQSAKDALTGKKRSKEGDEFLVKKKNPLQMPPDIDKMPEPGDGINSSEDDSDQDVKKILKLKNPKDNKQSNATDSDIIKNILEKIQ